MPSPHDFGRALADWAAREPSVSGLVLIGSRIHPDSDAIWRADHLSDWDFHIIASNPRMFADSAWTRAIPGAEVRAYAARTARIGQVPKVNAVFVDAEVDLVIIPDKALESVAAQAALGRHREPGETRQALQDLAVVIRPGWRFLKGADRWESIYRLAVAEVPDPRLSDAAVCELAEGFVCDYVWTLRKIDRGELLAAQRMLHRELAETNFRLLHELKLRRAERSFPEARRIERIADAAELAGVRVDARLDAVLLRDAVEKSAATLRQLTQALTGEAWHWPLAT